jgi:hypothetical protein
VSSDIVIAGTILPKRGRRPAGSVAMTNGARQKRHRQKDTAERLRCLAVLDMETDPFDNDQGDKHPFCAELYSDQFGSIVIWDEDHDLLIEKLYAAISALPDAYTIYAHNGGMFDYMFMIHKLRGIVKFKGRAIMSARIGNHELRDSLHILPEKLAAWKKDSFDYAKMRKRVRNRFRDEILSYLHSDCIYLFDFIRRFTKEFGLKISIGQAAFTELKKLHKIEPIKETMDSALRAYFLGGRVECIAGRGIFESRTWQKPYRLYDVNSMYPFVMAKLKHPVGREYLWRPGLPDHNTVFLDLTCKSYGAFFLHDDDGGLKVADNETGRFNVTIWEYQAALELDLIENVEIHWCIDNLKRVDFSSFVIPMYERRQQTKSILSLKQGTPHELEEVKKEGIFLKYLLNNAYGKCAQNPRKYQEYCYTDHNEKPEPEWFDFLKGADDETIHLYSYPVERSLHADVWARPNPGYRFHNVGTAASITGAARAVLLRARAHAIDPIYCDTDSLICRELQHQELSETELGAWKIEETFDRVIIAGKKTYLCEVAGRGDGQADRLKVRSKGVDMRVRPVRSDGFEECNPTEDQWRQANRETWQRYEQLLDDQIITILNRAPTFTKIGEQRYITRRVRATAPLKGRLIDGTSRIQNRTGKLPTLR